MKKSDQTKKRRYTPWGARDHMNGSRERFKVLLYTFVLSWLFLQSCSSDEEPIVESRFVTSDIELFWEVFDEYQGAFSEEVLQSEYLDKGSLGLRDYAAQTNLASTLRTSLRSPSQLLYYKAIRENTMDLSEAMRASESGLGKLAQVFSEAQIPRVYFLMGAMRAGGRIANSGLLIAVEMFSKDKDIELTGLGAWHRNVLRDREFLPSIVVHEAVHVQQIIHSGSPNFQTVLEKSIQEGMADYVSHKVLGNAPFFNDHLHEYGDRVEEEIWKEFEKDKDLKLTETDWLYTGRVTVHGQPADLGYYMGYKIIEAYADTFSTTEEAIKAMFTTNDYKGIFEQSKYAEKFE